MHSFVWYTTTILLANCVESPYDSVRFSSQPTEIYINFIKVPPPPSCNFQPANNPPVILELIVRLSCRGLSQRPISRNTRVSQSDISKVFRRVRETGRAIQRPHGHWLRMTKPREDRILIRIMRRNRFLSSSRIRVELIRRTGRRGSARTVQRHLVAAGCRSRRPARCPRLTHDHRRQRRVWARWHWSWNHQHWSHVIFADESRYSLNHCDGVRVRRRIGKSQETVKPHHSPLWCKLTVQNSNLATQWYISKLTLILCIVVAVG